MKAMIFALLALTSCFAHSYTQCQVTIDQIYTGDSGAVYISYEGGGSVVILASDPNPNQKNALSVALAAFAANRKIVVRYNGDNVSCTANLVNDFRGLTILKVSA